MPNPNKWKSVIDDIDNYDVANYIKDEVKTLIDRVKDSKFDNIIFHKEFLKDFIFYMDAKNIKAIVKMIEKNEIGFCEEKKNSEKKMKYFLSTRARFSIPDDVLYHIDFDCKGFVTTIAWMKWYLLLCIDEFCNASRTRIEINKLTIKMEARKDKLLNYK